MKSWIPLLAFCLTSWAVLAQEKRDYIWLFDADDGLMPILDFNEDPVSIQTDSSRVEINSSHAVIADLDGNLLFYSNGCGIYNRFHQLMENGDSLNPVGYFFDPECELGYTAGAQTMLILPHPQNDSLYYVIHESIDLQSEPIIDIFVNRLQYTLVDITANDGQGRVREKNVVLTGDTLGIGQLSAIRHANNHDWWIVTHGHLKNIYYLFLLNADGFHSANVQEIGIPHIIQGSSGGQAVFTPDGSNLIKFTPADGVFMMDFDRSTGMLSNFRQFHLDSKIDALFGGCAVSPSGQFLYISNLVEIWQFDLRTEDVPASGLVVAEFDGFSDPFPANFRLMQLAPDCKIYVSTGNGIKYLHVIDKPNERGVACDVRQHSIVLNSAHHRTIPYFPNYNLGFGPPCDTSRIVTASIEVPIPDVPFRIWPNPTQNVLHIEAEAVFSYTLTTVTGEPVVSGTLENGTASISTINLAAGLYFVTLQASNGRYIHEKVLIAH